MRVAAGAVAVEAADRDVVARRRHDRDVRERGRDRWRVAAQARRDSLVSAGNRVRAHSCPPWCGTGRRGRWSGCDSPAWRCRSDRWRTSASSYGSHCSRRSSDGLVERRGARVAGRGRGAGEHADVGRGLVAGLAAADGGRDGRVAGHVQGRSGNLAVPILKPPGLTFRCCGSLSRCSRGCRSGCDWPAC